MFFFFLHKKKSITGCAQPLLEPPSYFPSQASKISGRELPPHLANPGSRLSGPGGPRLSPRRLVLLNSSGLEPTTLKVIFISPLL